MGIAVLHEATAERRTQTRLGGDDVSWLLGARLKYGAEVRVIDISTGGVLYESSGPPATPQSTVVFELSSPTGTTLMPARVLRCQPVSNGTRFQIACAFKRPLSIDTLAAVSRPQPSAPAPTATRASWQRVVARFRSGQVVRGYTNDFHPSKTHVHLTAEDNAGEATKVALSQLKALFFVREFAGDPSRVDSTDFDGTRHGRKVEVVFQDGEVVRGTTLGYRDDGSGFFIQPADAGSNNMRIFVAPGAARRVIFL